MVTDLAATQELAAREPGNARAHARLGQLLAQSGDHAAAERAYRAALGLEPSFFEAQFNLGNALSKLGRAREAIGAFRLAVELGPTQAVAHGNLGSALHEQREYAAAVESLRKAAQLQPDAAHFHRNLGTALRSLGEGEQALRSFLRASQLRPDWVLAMQSVATSAMECGKWRIARQTCEAWLRHAPANVEALGLASIALEELGETRAAHDLVDFERMVRSVDLSVPAGFSSIDEFNRAVARHALEHPTLHIPDEAGPRVYSPKLHMTEEFCGAHPKGPAEPLAALVASAIDEYLAGLARDLPEHPFVVGAKRRFRLKSWAAVFQGEGHMEPHVHYQSHVSAVYYPKVPKIMQGESPTAGYLEFSGSSSRYPRRTTPISRAVQPREGMLLLFPSYFYHRTVPFESSEARISIAFDTEPLA